MFADSTRTTITKRVSKNADSNAWVNAIHEAAHAVVAVKLGVNVGKVTLHPPRCYVTDPTQDQNVHPWLIQCLAGEQAEIILCGINKPHCSANDRRTARALAKRHQERTGRDSGLTIHKAYARKAIIQHAAVIERVAKALLKANELSGVEVAELIHGHLRDPSCWV